jgi:uncharacterized membrane protein
MKRSADDHGTVSASYATHQREHEHLHGAFGADRFGQVSEKGARLFGTPQYIVGQSVIVVIWILLNAAAIRYRWDPYPFILLNLAFSTQAAYAAPLILLAQTRQADRDKAHEEAAAKAPRRAGGQPSAPARAERRADPARRRPQRGDRALTRSIHARVVLPAR